MKNIRTLFLPPILVSVVALGLVFAWGGVSAFALAAVLALLEITLSFDNAVVNAKILEKMSPRWQKRFLTWGMGISVIGVRVILPILIVSAVSLVSPLLITELAFLEPARYAALIASSQPAIDAFGGMFLFLVACGFFFDETKEIHWLRPIERRLAGWGEIAAIEVALALGLLLWVATHALAPIGLVLESGLVGVMLFLVMQALVDVLGAEAGLSARSGLALFIYLNMLDAAFSLDGVVGAFAITTAVPLIIVGLGIGAYFVRTMTLMLARGGIIRELRYLEHGAYWAILVLALSMLLSLVVPIPESLVASVGFIIITLAYLSSRRELRRAMR